MELNKIKQIAKQAFESGNPVEVMAKGENKTNVIALVESMDEKFLYLKPDEKTKENFLSKIRFILIDSIRIYPS